MYLFNFLTILEISANLRSASGAKRAELGCVRPTSWCPLMNSHAKRCHTLRPWTSSTAPPGYCTSGSKGQISAGENTNVKVSGLNENRQNIQCAPVPVTPYLFLQGARQFPVSGACDPCSISPYRQRIPCCSTCNVPFRSSPRPRPRGSPQPLLPDQWFDISTWQ